METVIRTQNTDTVVRQVLRDIYEEVNWAYLARNYFGKSRSWLYNKFSGRNNGVADDFSQTDREKLRTALQDIAKRINTAAEKL